MSKTIGVGLIGLGTVGGGVVRLLQDAPASMRRRKGVDLALRRVAVRDAAKAREVAVDAGLLTQDAMAVVRDPGVQMVVELTGAPQAYEWISEALQAGKDVVTANKALLAERGDELFRLALEKGADLMFEASVAGGIPIIRALRNGLVANRVESLYGILNGTTNYILTQMSRGAGGYVDTLRQAQEKGYAEPDPTFDVSGMDAAQKLAILCRIAFHTTGTARQIFCEGIERIEPQDIEYARELGYTIKLLAIAKRRGEQVEARVHPVMVPAESLIANIHDVFNAIEVVGSSVGTQVFYGRGAGQMPTASAVVADMVELAERRSSGAGPAIGDMIIGDEGTTIADMRNVELRYYLRALACDRPGVLAQIARILAEERISIASVIQKERDLQGGTVPLIIVTHEASEAAMQRALTALGRLDILEGPAKVIRIEAP
ncbi:MAG: homoserine dehydrogenase [Candidatus Handelsmanbacteria bacterium]|nr:homoserine dehydrogenase [Candidatus Handelsmanbacteria bacterium]